MANRNRRKGKPRRGLVELVNAMLTLVVLAILVVGGLLLYGAHSFYAAGPIKADTNFKVEKGNNLATVAARLEEQGLIDNRYVFEIGGWAAKKQGKLKAGEFKLAANASMYDVLTELTEGKPIQHGITIPEGFTIAQVVDRLNKDKELTGDLTSIPPEGGILPQTYNYEPGVARQTVLDRMVEAQQKAVAAVWAGHNPALPITSPEQMVILASIVEKETGLASERGHVAAVFMNRLQRHMRLQSDPTIIYGITMGKAPLGRPLKRSEVEAANPYNTYQIDGLPPTPIGNPGIDSLKAVANPDRSNDVYFVAASTNPADGHLFAATYAQHRLNVQKFRGAQKEAAEADANAAEDLLEQQQAAAAGDTTADTPAGTPPAAAGVPEAAPAPASTVAPAPAPAAPSTPAAATPAAPADDIAPNGAPLPMPADARPPDTTEAAPVAPAAETPAKPAPTRPSRPRPEPQDIFGG